MFLNQPNVGVDESLCNARHSPAYAVKRILARCSSELIFWRAIIGT